VCVGLCHYYRLHPEKEETVRWMEGWRDGGMEGWRDRDGRVRKDGTVWVKD